MRQNNLYIESNLLENVRQHDLTGLLSSIEEVIFIADAYNLELLYANDACYKVYGYSPAEIIQDKNIFLNSLYPDIKRHFIIHISKYIKKAVQYRNFVLFIKMVLSEH